MDKQAPEVNGGTGRVLHEIMSDESPGHEKNPHLKDLHELLVAFDALVTKARARADSEPGVASALSKAQAGFYGIERFVQWPEAGSLESLLAQNRVINARLRKALDAR